MAQEIISQIEKLISKTTEGKIDWKQLNPSTIRWTTGSGVNMYYVTIQMTTVGISATGQSYNYMMTIQGATTGEMVLQIQSNQNLNPTYTPLLKQLFEIVTEKTKEKSADILNKLLDNI